MAVAVGYVAHTGGRNQRQLDAKGAVEAGAPSPDALMAKPHLLVRDMAAGQAGYAGLLPLADPGGARAVTDLPCARLSMAAGNGVCLSDHGDILNPYKALFFGPDFKVRAEKPLAGVPSRARVSADGKYGSSTVFVTGDSYAPGSFSTRTTIWDMATGNEFGNLEDFSVWENGKQLQSPDHNFWGVTFDPANSGHFFATLGTKGHTFLVDGDVVAKKVNILRDGVECPDLSPDGTRFVVSATGPADMKEADAEEYFKTAVASARGVQETPKFNQWTYWYSRIWRFAVKFPGSERPPTIRLPDVTSSSLRSSLMKVDLPEPDGPTRNTNSPLSICSGTSRRPMMFGS